MKTIEEKKIYRCAIYTRKSVAEGLDSDFNTLDAQREAGENYISAQKQEGWSIIPKHYDDGGFSGGNMDRPALKELFNDIEAGRVDIVVVYKVDRLSRSIMDFAKIVELFEDNKVSFVSVTQHFNTKDSMGRLTLNILLSFAQFEREIISERIRDKIAASKKKGMWLGGPPILGYDTNYNGQGVRVNEMEALIVKDIFSSYLENRSLSKTVESLRQKGIVNKQWRTKTGNIQGGREFSKSTLGRLLNNKKYIGKIEYQGEIYDGAFDAIIDEDVFNQAQALLNENNFEKSQPRKNKYNALLGGKLYCAHCGSVMGHTYTKKTPTKVYRYYICGKAQREGWQKCSFPSVSADEIEKYVIDEISVIGSDVSLRNDVIKSFMEHSQNEITELEIRNSTLRKSLGNVRQRLSIYEREFPDSVKFQDLKKHEADILNAISDNEYLLHQISERMRTDKKYLEEIFIDFKSVWSKLTMAEQHDLIDKLIDKIVFDGQEGKLSISFKDNGIFRKAN